VEPVFGVDLLTARRGEDGRRSGFRAAPVCTC